MYTLRQGTRRFIHKHFQSGLHKTKFIRVTGQWPAILVSYGRAGSARSPVSKYDIYKLTITHTLEKNFLKTFCNFNDFYYVSKLCTTFKYLQV